MDMVKQATRCKENEYCTNCPSRFGCETRLSFYSEKEYLENVELTSFLAIKMGIAMGMEYNDCVKENNKMVNKMNKKRNRELELHPTYSVE